MVPVVVWFRRDLRIHDNPALAEPTPPAPELSSAPGPSGSMIVSRTWR
ncbi:deoxyribodipyrimidine photo-lyase [Candidatus Palauibacter sp.]